MRIDCDTGSAERDGTWVVPRRLEVRVATGAVKLDFTQAVITYPVLQVDADVQTGHLVLLTRPGIVVDAGDVAVKLGSVKVTAQPEVGAPVILRIEVTGTVHTGTITARPPRLVSPRRSFLHWLLRRPKRPALPG
jgi:hypothetical protein